MFSSKLYLYIYNHREGVPRARIASSRYTLTRSTRYQVDNICVTKNK